MHLWEISPSSSSPEAYGKLVDPKHVFMFPRGGLVEHFIVDIRYEATSLNRGPSKNGADEKRVDRP